mgnify:CR=1 FL=1
MLAGLSHGQAVVLMVANAAMWSIAGVVTRQLESAQSFEIINHAIFGWFNTWHKFKHHRMALFASRILREDDLLTRS